MQKMHVFRGIWAYFEDLAIPGKGMSAVRPRERRDRCREVCCGPQDRPRGILGCPFLMAATVVGGRRPGGHHRSDGQPIKMKRQPQRPAQILAHEQKTYF